MREAPNVGGEVQDITNHICGCEAVNMAEKPKRTL
jgi:hypothetical protein